MTLRTIVAPVFVKCHHARMKSAQRKEWVACLAALPLVAWMVWGLSSDPMEPAPLVALGGILVLTATVWVFGAIRFLADILIGRGPS